jgi:hypothetical protein
VCVGVGVFVCVRHGLAMTITESMGMGRFTLRRVGCILVLHVFGLATLQVLNFCK